MSVKSSFCIPPFWLFCKLMNFVLSQQNAHKNNMSIALRSRGFYAILGGPTGMQNLSVTIFTL